MKSKFKINQVVKFRESITDGEIVFPKGQTAIVDFISEDGKELDVEVNMGAETFVTTVTLDEVVTVKNLFKKSISPKFGTPEHMLATLKLAYQHILDNGVTEVNGHYVVPKKRLTDKQEKRLGIDLFNYWSFKL